MGPLCIGAIFLRAGGTVALVAPLSGRAVEARRPAVAARPSRSAPRQPGARGPLDGPDHLHDRGPRPHRDSGFLLKAEALARNRRSQLCHGGAAFRCRGAWFTGRSILPWRTPSDVSPSLAAASRSDLCA